ncbi:hypothetical protein RI129_005848 [Pyrocoelia pectoralis]|uniref:Uncharacterized protein n=1 Tax=Pyrocoelia pectoralis TaxID=417401 RepID=A0AAN7VD08_9COLE
MSSSVHTNNLNMKVFMFLCVGVSAILAVEINPELIQKWDAVVEPYKAECISTSGVQPDVAYKFFKNLKVLSEEHAFKCLIRCIAEKLHFFDASGEFNLATMKELMDEQTFKISEECAKKITATDDKCELVFQHATCSIQAAAELD